MQIKITLRLHPTQSEWLSSRKSSLITNAGEDVEKDEPLLVVGV